MSWVRRGSGLLIVVAAIAGVLWWTNTSESDDEPEVVDIGDLLETALVTRGDVADTDELTARLEFVDALEIVHRVDPVPVTITNTVGTGRFARTVSTTVDEPGERAITDLPGLGQVIEPGDVFYETDSTPVYVALGAVAAWRTMDADTTGRDVLQLEQWLVNGGWAGSDMTVDGEWTTTTTDAVEAWQAAVGLEETGVVELGDLWFLPGPVRVTSLAATEGVIVADGAALFSVTSTERTVRATVDDLPDGLLSAEDLRVRLPDRTEVPAALERIVGTDTGFELTVDAAIGADAVAAVDDLEVTLVWTVNELVDALTVPPEAIRHLDSGAYVVEVLEGDVVRTAEVEILGQAGRVVAVSGVDEAARVLIP